MARPHPLLLLPVCLSIAVGWSGRAAAQATTVAPAASPSPTPEAKRDDDKLAPNSVFAEGLGPGIFYSVNYERMVIDQLGVRVGLEYLSFSSSAGAGPNAASSTTTFAGVPITVSYVGVRSGRSCLELGAGATLFYFGGSTSSGLVATSGSGIVPLGVAMVGYRFQPVGHAGFMFRAGISALAGPGLSFNANNPGAFGVIPWPYLSFGASF